MQNAIKYYYNLNTDFFNSVDNDFLFNSNNEVYYLEKVNYSDKKIREVYELNRKMIYYNIFVHEIILNNFKQIVTIIDNKPYILMRINVNLNKKITLNDIAYFSYLTNRLVNPKTSVLSWSSKWEKKIDYYEQQAYEIGKKYMIAIEYFNYYIGLAENAISYINNIGNFSPNISFCHIRPSFEPLDFYNPFNFIVDYKVRDFSEYVKLKFFYNKIDISEIDNYIRHERLNAIDLNYFFARMLFPTYYFDLFEKIMDGTFDEKEISFIVKKSKQYESFLHELAIYLSKFTKIEFIEWI